MGGGVDTRDAYRMGKAALADEVMALRELCKAPPKKELERALARIAALEQRDADRARELMKVRAKARGWQAEAERQRKRADEEAKNATQWHALMLQAQIRAIVKEEAA